MRKIALLSLLLTAGMLAQAGQWVSVNEIASAGDWWRALANDGRLIKASNLGANAQPQVVKGIPFDIDYTNLSGADPKSSTWSNKFYSGTYAALSNLLNNGARINPSGPANLYINISGLTVGKEYRFQVLVGGDWGWCGCNLYAPEYKYLGLRGNQPTLAIYTWTADAATRRFTINSGAGQNTAYILAYAVHEVVPGIAWDPVPEDGAIDVNPTNVTLCWKTGLDPETMTQPNPKITSHYVYLAGREPNLLSATRYTVNAGPGPAAEACLNVGTLNYESVYYWWVDESVLGSGPADGNTISGRIWMFTTQMLAPVIAQGPANAYVFGGETVQFSVILHGGVPATIHWFRSLDNTTTTSGDDILVGSGSAVLTISNAQIANEGYYYCEVANASGTAISTPAALGIKRLLAYWSLDQADFNGTVYLDKSTQDPVAHNAEPNGIPTFVPGILGDAVIMNENGWANAGIWDPSTLTNQLTVSAWVKWDGTAWTSGGNGVITKADESGRRWMLMIRNGDDSHKGTGWVRFSSYANGDVWAGPNAVAAGEWAYLTAVVDSKNSGQVYINGALAAEDTTWSWGSANAASILLGNHYGGDIFPGVLDEIKIYNYALSPTEIADEYYAFTGQSVCLNPYESAFNFDNTGSSYCKVDLADFVVFARAWLSCGLYPVCP